MTHSQAFKAAMKMAKKNQEVRIVYFDFDYQAFRHCSLDTWEIWIDNGQVTDMDLRDVVNY